MLDLSDPVGVDYFITLSARINYKSNDLRFHKLFSLNPRMTTFIQSFDDRGNL